ncbi:MAG: alpha/beta fold hydrolase [Gammaproteobacteria bacterium]|jgi:medium-chain acyl-[acyl-carrier-protein] hydrolase|nr:alpha/beta fold hydrolase [Gammaproteobacteria bacterium]
MRLFCFPYAGGGSATYREWGKWLPADIEVATVQLPGREWRIQEDPLDDMRKMAADAFGNIRGYLEKPYALLGTSMGGLLIFELARKLREAGDPLPVCLLPFACGAPHTPETELFHKLPDEELIDEIRNFGVMTDAVADHQELVDLVLPVLRADCVAHETYEYSEEPSFDFPIWVYGGMGDDTMERARLDAWAAHTAGESSVHMINGGHLFVDDRPELLMQSLVRRLYKSLEFAG